MLEYFRIDLEKRALQMFNVAILLAECSGKCVASKQCVVVKYVHFSENIFATFVFLYCFIGTFVFNISDFIKMISI